MPLFKEHYKEVHLFPDEIPFNPCYVTYERLEELGAIETFIVKWGDEIVGYAIFTVNYNPHYQDHIYAVNDVIFVKPEHRHTGVADYMVAFCERYLKEERDVSVITYHMKPFKPFRNLMERNSYKHGEELFMKYVR